jgi:uncharacterized repeat protein (TIGR04052 family)
MNMRQKNKMAVILGCILVLSLLLTACSNQNNNTDGNITLQFAMKVGSQDIACGKEFSELGTAKTKVTFTDARFYVSNIRLVNTQGETVSLQLTQDGQWQYQNVALLDFENGSGTCSESGNALTHNTVTGKVPAGSYNAVIFDLGVPRELNHADVSAAAAPLNVPAMWWNWQGGYKFVRVDMRTSMEGMSGMNMGSGSSTTPVASGHGNMTVPPNTWYIHLGSTGCASPNAASKPAEACTNPNMVNIRLSNFTPGSSVIVADISGLLSGVPLNKNTLNPPGCMSGKDDPDCGPLFPGFGLNIQTGKCDGDCTAQKFFRLEGAETRK